MKPFLLFIVGVFVLNFSGLGQCPNDGQNPSTAELVCGKNANPHGTVPSCAGTQIPLPAGVCSSNGSIFTDVNSFYYTFFCYVSGPLEFTITPNNLSDDYDWQLFDITGRNPNDIYNSSFAKQIFVACNWSGDPGVTGTSLTATQANGCDGNGVPTITKAPNLIQGHKYILMISHFTSSNQSGYSIDFNGISSDLITNPVNPIPKLDSAYTACGGNTITLKISKQIKCSSINETDFVIATNPAITAVKGTSCIASTSYTDEIVITLANPLPTGNYNINVKKGIDGNTLVDECKNEMAAGNNLKIFQVSQKPSADFSVNIVKETCHADTIIYSHDGNNAVNKWLWTFDGMPTSSTSQSQQVIYNSFNTRRVSLTVSNAICTVNFTTNIPITNHVLIPKIKASRDTTCPNNPEIFIDSSNGDIINRFWDFSNGQTSNSPTPPTQTYPVLPINKIYPTKLIVETGLGCKDSIIRNIFVRGTIPTEFDSIIPPTCAAKEVKIYFNQAMVCSSVSPDGSEFSITGAAPTTIIGANISCIDGVGTVVTLQLSNALVTGSYNISLKTGSDGNTIINDCGIETLPKTISFNALGHVDPTFTYKTPKWGCRADTITFNHTINNLANSWQWSFIDGSPNLTNSALQSPTVIYSGLTNHQVQLVASNGACFDTSLQTISIIDHSIQAKFGFPDTTCGNGNTIFADSSTQQIVKWDWAFGNGMISNLQQPLPVNYPLAYSYKVYAVNLIVKNIVGCIDTSVTKFITVKPAAPAIMERMGTISCSPDSLMVHFNFPMLCHSVAADGSDFMVSGVSGPSVASASCFNGSNRDILVRLISPITVGGLYQLNLKKGTDGNTILNDCGIETPAGAISFLAYPKVDARFTVEKAISCYQDTLFLHHPVANDETKWNWIVNGTVAGNIPSMVLPYHETQTFRVSLTTSNGFCNDVDEKNIEVVFENVKAKFTVSNDIICPTETVEFQNLSTGNIKTYNWNWNNKQFYNAANPPAQSHISTTFPQPYQGTRYDDATVSLIVGNAVPCYDTAYTTLKMTEICLIKVPTAFTPNGDGLNDYLYPLNAYKAGGLTFKIYNKLGKVVFQSNDYASKWDGNTSGEKQPAGTYIWTLDYTDKETRKKMSLKGTAVMIR
jgi:gliding motility-associated-like protein